MKKDSLEKQGKKLKKQKRSLEKYPNLKRNLNLKSRRDYTTHHVYINGVKSVTGDDDGIRPLNDEELKWLNKFEGEYTNASVSQKDKQRLKNQLHNTLELAKDCTDRNNARNRCLLNIAKATNALEFRSWEEFDESTIEKLEGFDLELAIAASSELLTKDFGKGDDDPDDSGSKS